MEMRFDAYLEHLCSALGHADRREGLRGYCHGLMLPLARKSVEPLAASIDPHSVQARHQSLHHFVAKSDWSDAAILEKVGAWILPEMLRSGVERYWIIDDTGFPKKGQHSVGVARQYCGQLGKQDNCQVAVSLSLATEAASVPIAWRLYLPEAWALDTERRLRAGVPETVQFLTKPEIALAQVKAAQAAETPDGIVLADAGYGSDTGFRDGLTEIGARYAVGVQGTTSVWAPGQQPLPPKGLERRGAQASPATPRCRTPTGQCEGARHGPACHGLSTHQLAGRQQWRFVLTLCGCACSGRASGSLAERAAG